MSENLWVEFDKKIAALGTKADELEQMKGKLQNIPERLVNVKAQIKKLRESAQGLASKSLRTEIQKDIQKKVEDLDKIFKKLESTKTTSDPILAKLETALGELENYTVVKDSEIKQPEGTPEMKPMSVTPAAKPAVGPVTSAAKPAVGPVTPAAKPAVGPVTPAAKPAAKPAAGPVTPPSNPATKPNSVLSSKSPAFKPGAGPKQSAVMQASQPAFKPGAGPNQPAVKKATLKNTPKPAWNPSTKPTIKLGGYFSSKKYSKKKNMKKQHKSKKHKKSKKFQKVHKVKKNKSRKYRR